MRAALTLIYGGGLLFALVSRSHAPWWWWTFGIVALVGLALVPEPGRRKR